MHSVPRCKQRFARSPARLAGQPPLAGYFKGARNRIDESDGRLAQRRGQVGGGALSWQAGPTAPPEMKGLCAAGVKPKAGSSWNGWGGDERNTRFQPAKA